MSFQTFQFFIFFIIVFLAYYFISHRYRWIILLASSFIFYAALKAPGLMCALILVILNTYYCGLWIGKNKTESKKKFFLSSGIIINLLILIYIKYLPFFIVNINSLIHAISSALPSIPPGEAKISIGVSFYVFQAISYLIDIYLKILEPEKHFGYFALSLSFFPKLLQGPIERSGNLLPQLRLKTEFSYNNLRTGLIQFTFGLFKKVVIANRLAVFVNGVFSDVHSYVGVGLIMTTYYYAFQIYFDFSGYTDMALGIARIFNIELTDNFNSPYRATSIADFWRRWHISFSRWILDYIFKPLQMKMRSWKEYGNAIALFITFFISGLWHGASWGFIIWGLLHGTYLAISVFYRPWQKRIHQKFGMAQKGILILWQRVITFQLVCFAWIFFRADNLSDAFYIVTHLFSGLLNYAKIVFSGLFSIHQFRRILDPFLLNQKLSTFLILIISLSLIQIIAFVQKNKNSKMPLSNLPAWLKWSMYYALIIFIWSFGIFGESKFIYFQF